MRNGKSPTFTSFVRTTPMRAVHLSFGEISFELVFFFLSWLQSLMQPVMKCHWVMITTSSLIKSLFQFQDSRNDYCVVMMVKILDRQHLLCQLKMSHIYHLLLLPPKWSFVLIWAQKENKMSYKINKRQETMP